MSETKENPYPQCIKCKVESNPQDMRGWEKIIIGQEDFGVVWLCPNCIVKFQHTKDLLSLKDSQRIKELEDYNKMVRLLADFKYLLDEMDKKDSPINDYDPNIAGGY